MIEGVKSIVLVALLCLPSLAAATPPVVGSWDGSWGYSNGPDKHVSGRFHLTFADREGKIVGTYQDLDSHRRQKVKIFKISDTSPDQSTYRMDVDDECWNINVVGDQLDGIKNGGPCSSIGLGSGARLIGVHATRVLQPANPR